MKSGEVSSAKKWRLKIQLLSILYAANRVGWERLNRYQVQKLYYLATVLSPLKGFIAANPDYHYDKNGPWSPRLQHCLDHLVAIGLVHMPSYIVTQRNHERALYAISVDGSALVDSLIDAHRRPAVELEWLTQIFRAVEGHGFNNLLDLVYQEPTFKTLRVRQAHGDPLTLEGPENESLGSWYVAEGMARTAFGKSLALEDLLWIYFGALRAHSSQEEDGLPKR